MNPNITPKGVKNPFRYLCMSIGYIPTSYKECMDYYEQVLWLIKFLENTVIPAVDNNAAALTELQGLFVTLKDYVEHYFDNLDVQDEINNKLDEMGESGELANIIINYFKDLNVNYEQFGAYGDGVHDDYTAIKNAHDYANANNLNVLCNGNKTYLIKNVTASIEIKTNVDWNNSTFIIDDTDNPNNIPIFKTIPNNEIQNISSTITQINKNQKKCNITGYGKCLVHIENSNKKDFIRSGGNQDSGHNRTDIFRIENDGTILDDIIWDFNPITKIVIYPIDDNFITLKNGVFETKVNNSLTNYLTRNIQINRSNVIVDNITHTLTGEDQEYCSPYDGFIETYFASNIIIKNCNLSGHKTFSLNGTNQGNYDLYNIACIDVTMDNIQQINSITDTNLWGLHTSNYSKDLKLYNSNISRFDAHMGVHNFEIKNCNLGYQGIKFVGSGLGIIENTSVDGNLSFVELREDYGATFDGKLIINNCELISNNAVADFRYLIQCRNSENWDYGYKCYAPEIEVNNFKSYVYSSCQAVCVYGFRSHTANLDFDSDYETNASNSKYPYLFTNNIKLKNLYIMNNDNCKYDLFHYLEPMLIYIEKTGTSINKHNNLSIKNGNTKYNLNIELDNVKISTNSLATSNWSITKCSLWNVGGINLTDINFNNTHRPVMNIKLKNCDYVNLGLAGRPVAMDIDNCKLYLIRCADNSSNFIYNYFKIKNSDFIFNFITNDYDNSHRIFDNKENEYEVENCNFVFGTITDENLNLVATYNFPFNYTDTTNIIASFNDILNCNFIGITDTNLKTLTIYDNLNRRYGKNLNTLKNHNNFIQPKICGYDYQLPVSTDYCVLTAGSLFYDITNSKMKLYNGTEWIDL